MNQTLPSIKLSLLRILLIAGVSLITFLLLLFPVGYIGVLFHSDPFRYWYDFSVKPCFLGLISTLTGELTAHRHYLGGWIAGSVVLAVFGGTEALYLHIDTTDRPTKFIEFLILGVVLGIIALYVLRFLSKRKIQ